MNETVDSLSFLKDTINKFKLEIQKFISDPNYDNQDIINLRNNVDDIEKNILNREKQIVNNISTDKNSSREFYNNDDNNLNLPKIKSSSSIFPYNTLMYKRKSNISSFYLEENEKISKSNSNFGKKKNTTGSKIYLDPLDIQKEKVSFRQNIETRKRIKNKDLISNIIERKQAFIKNKEKETLLQKYDLNLNSKNECGIRRSSGIQNYMLKGNMMKYSSANKDYNFQAISYDKTLRPIINDSEISKGLLHMINKGIIPRDADLTPAFNKEGNPLTVNKELEIEFPFKISSGKTAKEVDEERKEKYKWNTERKDDLFITGANEDYAKSSKSKINSIDKSRASTSNSPMKVKQVHLDIEVNEKSALSSVVESEDYEVQRSLALLFSDFKIMKDENYNDFHSKNIKKWGIISYLIDQLQKVLRKFNFSLVEVDGKKLEDLSRNQVKKLAIKDMISCMTDKELISRNLDTINPKILLIAIKEASVHKIQNNYRNYLSYKKLLELRSIVNNVIIIQSKYKQYKINESTKILLSDKREQNLKKIELMLNKFKKNWRKIKSRPRIEIHMNSISKSVLKNFTIEKFSEKENNQLARLISLRDPNVEIIYISPYHLSNEILSYYFSIIQSLGVENAKNRFHLIVPNSIDNFPPGYSLAKLLHYSKESISRIRDFIKGREDSTYIIPGLVSKHDIDLSIYLDCPLLMGDINNTEALFTKSGAKRVLELTNMALPISVWDVNSDKDFFNILANMIINYPTVNIWVFKMNCEFKGRGIAYIVLDRIKEITDLKKDKHTKLISDEKYRNDLNSILRKCIIHKVEILANRIYKGWNEYYVEYLNYGGVIEACPTYSLSSIIGNPAIAFFIEPDGGLEAVCTYDKINSFSFRNFGGISPQFSIPDLNVGMITKKLGNYLYEKGIIGYVTVEFIVFMENEKLLFWAVDLNYGLSDLIVNFKFCDFLCTQSSKVAKINNSSDVYNESLEEESRNESNPNNISENKSIKNEDNHNPNYYFTFTPLIHPSITNFKMKELVSNFRNEQLVFNVESKTGAIFMLPDVLQCGMLGISGINDDFSRCIKLIDDSISLIKSQIMISTTRVHLNSVSSTDIIEVNEIFGRIKMLTKKLEEKFILK